MKRTIESLNKHLKRIPEHFKNDPGQEPYSLYLKYAQKSSPNALISDLGTFQGLSALTLSINDSNIVESYDIDLSNNLVTDKDNIKFIQGNIFDHIDRILESDLILVDVDPHDGIQEQEFYDILVSRQYKGVTLWDDIFLNLGMQNFWHKVKLPKEDLTSEGHYTGTGLILF